MKRVAVTGGGGQIAYSLLFRLGAGELLGPQEKIALHILETPSCEEALRGVVMELKDCAFPLLTEIKFGSNPREIFQDVDIAFLIGAKPRGPGMERKDLLLDNGKIFIEQGKALDEVASKEVIVLVIGNPCNTNCLLARQFAKRIRPDRFFSMMRLDQNRAVSFLADRAKVSVKEVSDVVVWGNHSSTQVPDFLHAKIRGQPACDVLKQEEVWLKQEFIPLVQKRGAEVITARGKSSAGSAANAAIDAMRSLLFPSAQGEVFSMGVYSSDNPYGIDQNLMFSFPCVSRGGGDVSIVGGWEWDSFLREKILLTEKELLEERGQIAPLLAGVEGMKAHG